MDEATSSLDSLTEKTVMKTVSNLENNMTLIIVAHRLSTVRHCDLIYLLDKGTVTARGTYEELVLNNKQFAEMAKNS